MVQGWWPDSNNNLFLKQDIYRHQAHILVVMWVQYHLPPCEHSMGACWDPLVWHHCHYPFLSLSLSILRWQITSGGQCQPCLSSSNCWQWPATIWLRLASPSHSLILFHFLQQLWLVYKAVYSLIPGPLKMKMGMGLDVFLFPHSPHISDDKKVGQGGEGVGDRQRPVSPIGTCWSYWEQFTKRPLKMKMGMGLDICSCAFSICSADDKQLGN